MSEGLILSLNVRYILLLVDIFLICVYVLARNLVLSVVLSKMLYLRAIVSVKVSFMSLDQ